jgi:hypothetical protein
MLKGQFLHTHKKKIVKTGFYGDYCGCYGLSGTRLCLLERQDCFSVTLWIFKEHFVAEVVLTGSGLFENQCGWFIQSSRGLRWMMGIHHQGRCSSIRSWTYSIYSNYIDITYKIFNTNSLTYKLSTLASNLASNSSIHLM